jgi:hypothetical protein
MNRKVTAILLLQASLACLACGGHENAFQRKRICAELGRQRLEMDRRKDETESEGVTHAVRAEWCFSAELNTCIYSSTNDIIISSDPNKMASIVMSTQSTIDLLTNQTLVSVERVKAGRTELEEYERKRSDFFSKCQ